MYNIKNIPTFLNCPVSLPPKCQVYNGWQPCQGPVEIAPSSEDQGQDSSSPLIGVVVVVVVILYCKKYVFFFFILMFFSQQKLLQGGFCQLLISMILEMDLGIPY